jgi:dTDP-4-dehydrorhamnose reductase
MKKKILILGSSGLLGSHLLKFLKRFKKKYQLSYFKRNKKHNFNNIKFTSIFFEKNKFDFIINLSAITNVDKCYKDKKLAKQVNFEIVKNICKVIIENKLKTHFIQISTDQIYFNYKKNLEKNFEICNYYAKTKILAENEVKKINFTILRTNFFGKSYNKKRVSFSDWIYNSLSQGKCIFTASDILFSPVRINTLCKVIHLCLIKKNNGIFNVGSKRGFSKYYFSILFAKLLKLNKNLIFKTELIKLNLLEKRHKDMRMNVKKFEKTFNFKLPLLREEIKKEIKNYE